MYRIGKSIIINIDSVDFEPITKLLESSFLYILDEE